MMSRKLTEQEIYEALHNPKKRTPEQRAKGEELARKMKGISSEELQELRKKAKEEFGI